MTQQELIKRLETTCFGLDPIDPLRLLVDDVIAALAQHDSVQAKPEPEQDHIPDARKMVTEQEPVAYWKEHAQGLQRDYDSLLAEFQAQRSESSSKPSAWVGLTDEQITQVIKSMPRGIKGWMSDWDLYEFSKAIEAKLREKNSQHKERNT